MIQKSGMKATGTAMSTVEILVALYYGELNGGKVLNFDAKKPGWDEQDYLVLSKHSATPVLYAILADLGFFDEGELDHFAQLNSLLQARPYQKISGVSVPALTVANGLSAACGLAMAIKMDRQDNRVYVVADIAELQSGQFWEMAMVATHHNLNNLVLILDDNSFQTDGTTRSVVDLGGIQTKLDAFGWQVFRVNDGNNYDAIFENLVKTYKVNRRPTCLWCHTVSGKGIDFAERKHGYFAAQLSEPELEAIKLNLKTK